MNHRLTLCGLAALLALSGMAAAGGSELVFVGSGLKDIEAFRFDTATGALATLGQAAALPHPSFLALAPHRPFLYAISEGQGPADSRVSAYSIDAASGRLSLVNSQPAGGGGPCYVEIDPSGKNALIANYGTGSVAVFPIAADGSLGAASAFVQDTGSSVNPARQEGPHAHCIVTDPGNKFAFVCDLGLDKVMVFSFDPSQGSLTPATPPFVSVKPGAGPRHIAFHPNARYAYVINEMGSTLSAFTYDAAHGALREIQTESTLPQDFSGQNTDAEVAVHPSGKFVYASNRGHDSIAVFKCNPRTGLLTFAERVPTGGKTPRQFEIDPSGAWLLAANQDSDTIVVFRIDPGTGHLQAVGAPVSSRTPMCVKFLPPEP